MDIFPFFFFSAAIRHPELRKVKPLAGEAPWLHMFSFKPLLVEDQNDNEKEKKTR